MVVVEAVELVMTALSAGAAAGVSSTASAAVKDAYTGLKALVAKAVRRAGTETEAAVADEKVADSDLHRAALVASLSAAAVESDTELLQAAAKMLALTDPRGSGTSKYCVDVYNNQGVQVGECNTMTLNLDK